MTIIADPVASHAKARGSALAVVDLETGRRWNYAELNGLVDRVAGWLVTALGPKSGERVATLSKNCAEMLILNLACARAGAVFVPLNWRLAVPEIQTLIADAAPQLLFCGEDFADIECAVEKQPIGELETIVANAAPPPAEARGDFDAPATLLYTSGTSGRPKGVIVTESNAFWGNFNFITGNGVTQDSVFLCDMPLFHTAGLFAAARVPILAGAAVLISKGFDPVMTLERLADPALKVTHYFSVPQMATVLWQQPNFDPAKLRNIVAWAIGGAPNPRAQSERFIKAGIRIAEGFGMSETCSTFGMPPFDFDLMLKKAGSSGLPFMTVRFKIMDDDGQEVPVGETGELWLAGPNVTPGYWNQPELTDKAFEGEWFKTGDAAMRDADGFIYLVDRKKDMYISGGENVYPAEVEAALAELAQVAEAAVIGMPDDRWGEVGHAYVILRIGHSLEEQAVLDHLRGRLAKYKVPTRVIFTDAIPRTASGKVQKHVLKAQALEKAGG